MEVMNKLKFALAEIDYTGIKKWRVGVETGSLFF